MIIPAIGADKFSGVDHSCTINEANIINFEYVYVNNTSKMIIFNEVVINHN